MNGSGVSANNLGIMFHRGYGMMPSTKTALNYYKLAASRKVVRAMKNVADVYLNAFDKENTRKRSGDPNGRGRF